MTWILALCMLLIHWGRVICCLALSPVNCIDGQIEFMWSSNIWTSSWWGQRMNVSSTYLSHKDGFSDVDPNAISSKYPMYMLANTGDNGEVLLFVGIYQSKSTFPLDYLSGYKCVLPARDLKPVYPVSHQ